jgi:hypothetical protein
MTAAELALGVSKEHIDEMQSAINQLEWQNDAIGLTRVRHAVSQRLVEIRLLLRDGHLKNMNGGSK